MGFEPVLVTWPPLRLARMRFERGSVGVVRPPGSQRHQLTGWEVCDGTQVYRTRRLDPAKPGEMSQVSGGEVELVDVGGDRLLESVEVAA